MKCAKCSYKTEDPELMAKHINSKHKQKYEVSKYTFTDYLNDTIKNRNIIKEFKDLFDEEISILKDQGKILECKLCKKEALKEKITEKELKEILIIDSKLENKLGFQTKLDAEKNGVFKKEMWFCKKCAEENEKRIEHWDEVEELREMRNKILKEDAEETSKILEKSIFYSGEFEEYDYILTYEKKIKKEKKHFSFRIVDDKAEWNHWLYGNDEIDKNFTKKELDDIGKEGVKVYNEICDKTKELFKKHNEEMKVKEVIFEEYSITYLKERKYWNNENEILITIPYSEDYDDADEIIDVEEIIDRESTMLGDWELETIITNEKRIHEFIWKTISEKDKHNEYKKNKKLISHSQMTGHSNLFELKEEICKKETNLRKLFAEEEYEIEICFSYRTIRLFRTIEERKNKYYYQYRDNMSHEPFSEKKEIVNGVFGDPLHTTRIFTKQLEWIKKIENKITLLGKINRVGENSRHIVLDKVKGLKRFYGFSVDDVPSDTDLKVEYEKGRIIITELKPIEKTDILTSK